MLHGQRAAAAGSRIMTTERLILREMRQAGFAAPAEILQDPAVMYACGHTFTAEEVQAWLDRQKSRYRQYGFGLQAIQLKARGRMIGQAGLTMQAYRDTQAPEIGYLLKNASGTAGTPSRRPPPADNMHLRTSMQSASSPSSGPAMPRLSGWPNPSACKRRMN